VTAADVHTNGRRWAGETILVLTLAAVCFGLALHQEADVDLGFHLKTGEHVLRTGTVPQKDIFSYTNSHKDWPLHYWIPDVLMYGVYARWGISGLILAKCVVVALIFLVLYGGIRRLGVVWPLALILVVWALVMARPRFSIRPLLGSQLLLAILAVWWMQARSGRAPAFRFLPVLFMVWANVHAGMVYGVILLGTVCGVEVLKSLVTRVTGAKLVGFAPGRLRSLMVWSGIGLAVSVFIVWVMNPLSVKGLLLPFQFYRSEFFMSVIEEYGHVSFPRDSLFGLMLLGAAGALVLNRRNLDWSELALVGVFGFLAATSVRIIIVFGIVVVPILARNVQEGFGERLTGTRRRMGPGVALASTLAACAALLVGAYAYGTGNRALRPGFGFDARTFPEKAFRFIDDMRPDGEIFNSDMWGGPMILHLYPRYKVFVDGRQEVYEEDFWRRVYFPILAGAPGWDEILERYGVNLALLRNTGQRYGHRISEVMWESPDWVLVYWDDLVSLFARNRDRNRRLLETGYRVVYPDGFDVEAIRSEGRLEEAADELERKVREDPGSWRANLYLAETYLAAERPERAREIFRGILDRGLMESPVAASFGLGDAFLEAGFPDSALACYRSVRRDARDDLLWRLKEIRALGMLGQDKDAQDLVRGIPEGRGRSDAQSVLARALLDGGRGGAAVRVLEEAVRREPRNPELCYGLGLAYEEAGRPSDAEAAYREALSWKPDFSQALNNLAWILAADARKLEEAGSLAEKAAALVPGDPQVLDTLGWIQYLRGENRAAVTTLAAAVGELGASPGPGSEDIFYHLGAALERTGDQAAAVEAYGRALAIDPEYSLGISALERLGVSPGNR